MLDKYKQWPQHIKLRTSRANIVMLKTFVRASSQPNQFPLPSLQDEELQKRKTEEVAQSEKNVSF